MSNRPEPAPICWLQIASLRSLVLPGDGSVATGPSPRAKRRRAIDQERICSVACALGCPMAREPGIDAGFASARRRDRDTGCRIMSGSLERQSDPRRTSLLDGTCKLDRASRRLGVVPLRSICCMVSLGFGRKAPSQGQATAFQSPGPTGSALTQAQVELGAFRVPPHPSIEGAQHRRDRDAVQEDGD